MNRGIYPGMWKFYKALIKQLPALVFRAYGLVSFLAAISLFAATLFNRSWVGVLKEGWEGISPLWSLVIISAFVIFGLLRINYEQFLSLEEKIRNQEKEIDKLRERLEPRFEIIFGEDGSFEQVNKLGVDEIQRLYRIGVVNQGGTTITNVRVQLEKIDDYNNPFLPVELRQMHDNTPPYKRSFSLNPEQTQFVDVVSKRERGSGYDVPIVLWYAVEDLPNTIPRSRYKLHILVIGDNVQPHRQIFRVGVNDEGRLLFGKER